METLQITLSKQELQDLTSVLGQLPTASNAYPLYLKLRAKLEIKQQDSSPNDEHKPQDIIPETTD